MQQILTGIVLFNDIEVLDFCGPFEVLSVTRCDESRRREEPSPFDVRLIAQTLDPITTSGGMRVIPQHSFSDAPQCEILVVPGGWGVRREIENLAMTEWIQRHALGVKLLTSVCTGSMLLGKAGLLDGRRATTHWKSLGWMRDSFRAVQVEDSQHVVEDGHIITSAGISAGIDMALKIVERYFGEELTRATARHMEYSLLHENLRRV